MRSLPDFLDMHVHVCHFLTMRTTIELGNDKRAKLLELAARRGEKGFSRIVDEALSAYFESLSKRDQQVRAALSAIGSLQDIEADRLEEEIEKLKTGIGAKELEKAKIRFKTDFILGRETVMRKAESLQHYAYFHDELKDINKDLEKYMSVTVEDIMRVANQYLISENRTVVIANPAGKESS